MQVRPIDHAGLPVLLLEGEVDLYQSPILRALMQEHVKAAEGSVDRRCGKRMNVIWFEILSYRIEC